MSEDTRFTDLSDIISVNIKNSSHIYQVDEIIRVLMMYHHKQEETYQLSFSKRGEMGVWMNLARKYDRIDTLSKRLFEEKGKNSPVLVDTLIDTVIYALKWLAVIKVLRPEDIQEWMALTYARTMNVSSEKAMDLLFDHSDEKPPAAFYDSYAEQLGLDVRELTYEEKKLAVKLALSGSPRDEDREEL